MLFWDKDKSTEEKKIVDTIRCLALDMINEAGSGHSGIVLDAAPILYTLYAKHLKINPEDPKWYNRDHFVLSCGHASALLYATLFISGYDLTLEDLKQFRKIDSKTPGHPEYGVTPGVDITTGPLGQGFASAVGMAISEEYLRNYYLKKNLPFINYYTYTLCSDGDLMEGVSYEAASLAGTLKLSHLIAIYDCNQVTLDGNINMTFTENVMTRFQGMNWNVLVVQDGEDLTSLDHAIEKAKTSIDKPTLIIVQTVIGRYSKNQGTNLAHGMVLDKEEIKTIKTQLGLRDIPFTVSQDTIDLMQGLIHERIEPYYKASLETEARLTPEDKADLENLTQKNSIILDNNIDYSIIATENEALRVTNGKILNQYAKTYPFIMGGSADLSSSTKTYLEDMGDFSPTNRTGKNIWFGVREHAMAAILNGISLSGIRTFASTFMAFSDYMKPAIRLSSIMNLPVTYIFTHDSITIGEDGPTHQPVEQLVSLRSIPNLEVFRPADINELIGTYQYIMNKTNGPSVISLSRNSVNTKNNTSIKDVVKGGYIIKKELKNLSGIIIASGEEVDLALEVANRLEEKGFDLRVVSFISIELFNKQKDEYKQEILPLGTKTFVIEPSSSYSWNQFVYNDKYLITLDKFGKSGSKEEICKQYGFNVDDITTKIENLLK